MSFKSLLVYLILLVSQFSNVVCDGAHGADGGGVASSATVDTTSSDGEGPPESVSSLLSGISPDILSSLAGNPQIAQALRTSGVDVGAPAAAEAAAEAGGTAVPSSGGGPGGLPSGLPGRFPGGLPGGFPGGLAGGLPGGFPGGLAGGLPGGFPGGLLGGLGGLGGLPFPFLGGQKSLHVSGDFGLYYPYIEKIIIIVGGGILLLVILALLAKGFSKGGLLFNLGSSLSEALAGSASVDIGPVHKSVAGAAAVSAGGGRIAGSPQDLQLTQRVHNGLDQRF